MRRWGVLLLGWSTLVTADDSLGRLFYSPAERAALDAARAAPTEIALPMVQPDDVTHLQEPHFAAPEIAPAPLPTLTLNGIVKRQAGPSTVWMNGSAQDAKLLQIPGIASPRAQVGRDGVRLSLRENEASVELKVGQTLEPAVPAPNTPEAPGESATP